MNSPKIYLVVTLFVIISTFDFRVCSAQDIIATPSDFHGYNISCHGASDGFINISVVGGEPPFLYNWSNGSYAKNQSNLPAGVYTVVVTDGNNSTFSTEVELKEPKVLAVNLFPVVRSGIYHISELGGQDGEIDASVLGGVPPYTYLWSNSSTEKRVGELSAGSYYLVVTGTNECTVSASTTLLEPTALQITSITSPLHNGNNISCFNGNDGDINLVVTGGSGSYSYQWSNGAFTKDLTDLKAGHYSVIVKDGGTPIAAQITLTEPDKIGTQLTATVYPNGKNISCFGCANGHVSSSISGGVTPYSFLWNDGPTSLNRSGLGAGGYSVQVTDGNGCRAEAGLNISAPEREDWTMMGNAGTDPVINFFGTTDAKDVVLKTNNMDRLRIKSNGDIKINSLAGSSYEPLYVDPSGQLLRSDPGNPQIICKNWSTCGNLLNSTTSFIGSINNYDLTFKTNDIERLRITNSGSIKIKNFESLPNGLVYNDGGILNVINYGSASQVLLGNGTFGQLPGGASYWSLSGSNSLYNTNSSGRVGIGTSVPSEQLEVEHSDQYGGISINQNSNTYFTNEIKFKYHDNEKWAIGSNIGNNADHTFFIWDHIAPNGVSNLGRTRFVIDALGNTGIDIEHPNQKLDVNGNIIIRGLNGFTSLGDQTSLFLGDQNQYIRSTYHGGISIGTYQAPDAFQLAETTGNFGLGGVPSLNASWKLRVYGGIAAEEIKVTTSGNFPDYVFEKDYILMSISELGKYIYTNGHLPGIPSKKEVDKNDGFELGSLQMKMLEKIEEQTLYILNLQKQIDDLHRKLEK